MSCHTYMVYMELNGEKNCERPRGREEETEKKDKGVKQDNQIVEWKNVCIMCREKRCDRM